MVSIKHFNIFFSRKAILKANIKKENIKFIHNFKNLRFQKNIEKNVGAFKNYKDEKFQEIKKN
ncbi:hypothetical protein BpHYR1_008875 [Brachionus plicatilis]|uniref:Uncharacterized protein n=1 Tax=Brachionus plicatilis TaxID=10195 RepID=A0A3M7PNH0_BRAPC|nr:hypothetical protein BpHYR1_008875 [Brachionus plicatilis]